MNKIGLCLLAWAYLLSPPVETVWAQLGLSTKMGLVTMENLQPGETYNTREAVNIPYVLTNRSAIPVSIHIEIQKPGEDKGMKEMGYEPIPDTSWVKLSKYELPADPGQDVATDIFITVPNDDKHLGKKYQVNLAATAKGKQHLAVGLLSKVRFTVALRRLTADELSQRKKAAEIGDINFDLSPDRVFLENVPLGRKVNVSKQFKQTLKLSNPNKEDFIYLMGAGTPRQEEMENIPGYEDAPDASFLSLDVSQVKVKANSIKKIGMVLKFPDKDEYKGKKYCFIVRAEVLGAPVELRKLVRVFVSTKP